MGANRSRRLPARTVAVAALAVAALAAGAASARPNAEAAKAPTPKSGGSVVLGGSPTADLWWGSANYNASNNALVQSFMGSLFDPPDKVGGQLVPNLALDYSYNKNKTVFTMHLRKGVKFSDGTPFNAAAIAWLWSKDIDGDPVNKASAYLEDVKSVKAVGDSTVVVTFTKPNALFAAALGQTPLGLVASPTAYQKAGAAAFNQMPVGAGAFVLKQHVPGQIIELAKNPNYWDAKHIYLSTIRQILTGTDANANWADVQTGQIHATELSIKLAAPPLIKDAMDNKNVQKVVTQGSSYIFINYANADPFWNSGANAAKGLMARQAIAYCLDRESIVNNLLGGFAEPAYVLAGPSKAANFYPVDAKGRPSVAAAKKLMPYKNDQAKAKALVQQLGGLTFPLSYTNDLSAAFVTAVIQELAACNINAKANPVAKAAETSTVALGNYTAYLQSSAGVADPRLFMKYISPEQPNDQQGQVNDPVITYALHQSYAQITGEAQTKEWNVIFQRLNKQALALPIVAYPIYTVVSNCIKGYHFWANHMSYARAWNSC